MAKPGFYLQTAKVGLPSSSWWLGAASREEFDERQRHEQQRMAGSALGQTNRPALAKDTERVDAL